MTVILSKAVDAYNQAVSKAAETGPGGGSEGPSFAELVSGALRDSVGAARQGEQISLQAVANQADLNEVVTAVTNAEVTLQTVVAIRDRVIQAYQDIIRMPI